MSTAESMDGWVRACSLADLDEDQPVHADFAGRPVWFVRSGGAVYALRDECTHQAVPLSEGERRYDVGTLESYCAAFLEHALSDARFGAELRARAAALLDAAD